jgi:hypothetical protein
MNSNALIVLKDVMSKLFYSILQHSIGDQYGLDTFSIMLRDIIVLQWHFTVLIDVLRLTAICLSMIAQRGVEGTERRHGGHWAWRQGIVDQWLPSRSAAVQTMGFANPGFF